MKNVEDKMKIIVVGDVHAKWNYLNELITEEKPDIILACGDFGYWPSYKEYSFDKIIPQNTKIYWCDGNHEDHWSLKRRLDENDGEPFAFASLPNVVYMPRGSVLELPDGRNVLFMGGADSVDKSLRILGKDWFPEEYITTPQILSALEIKKQIDIIISHTCPQSAMDMVLETNPNKVHDPNPIMLEELLKQYKPKQWFFGHWHFFAEDVTEGCQFTALNKSGSRNWWRELK